MMTQTTQMMQQQRARRWLTDFSARLDEVTPIDELRSELRTLGADVEGVHDKLAQMILSAKIHRVLDRVTQWISPIWQPLWAGQAVTADDIPKQDYTFLSDYGKIAISCEWNAASATTPAFLKINWEASLESQSRLVARFINPESQEIRADICLGTSLSGEETLTADELGFDPSSVPWAISLILRDASQ